MTTLLVFKRKDDDIMLSLVQEENALMIVHRESEVKNIEVTNNEIGNEQTMIKILKHLGSTLKFNRFSFQMGGITIHQRKDGRYEIGGAARSVLFDSIEILP